MSLIKQYMSILNEDKSFTSSGVAVDNTGELEGAEKAKESALPKNSGPEAVEVEKPVKGPHSEVESDALPKAVNAESKNPFDLLYNKILAEEAFGDEEGDTFDFEGEMEDHGDDFENDLESPEGTEEHEEGEEEGLEAVLDHLKNAVATLEKLVSSSEDDLDEESDDEDEMDEDGVDSEEHEGEGVPVAEEAVEAEYEGHALVDQEKLEKGLNKPSSQTVKGAVPVTKKKAEVTKGKKADGKLETLSGNPEDLVSKAKQNVGGVTAGKGLFEQ
jgi:hypothetical protein